MFVDGKAERRRAGKKVSGRLRKRSLDQHDQPSQFSKHREFLKQGTFSAEARKDPVGHTMLGQPGSLTPEHGEHLRARSTALHSLSPCVGRASHEVGLVGECRDVGCKRVCLRGL